jgi:hypothetical protein
MLIAKFHNKIESPGVYEWDMTIETLKENLDKLPWGDFTTLQVYNDIIDKFVWFDKDHNFMDEKK